MRHARNFGLIAVALLLAIILCPFTVQAQDFGVSPSEVRMDNISPDKEASFDLIIRNKDDAEHTFILSTCDPDESQRRPGRAKLPDDSWIHFSSQQKDVLANSQTNVKVTVNIPQDSDWVNKDWEIWLSVTPESTGLLVVNYYIRLLISTSGKGNDKPNTGLIAGIIAVLLFGYTVYYFQRKAKSK